MLFSDSDSNINCNTGWSIETLKCRPRTDKVSLDAFGYVHTTHKYQRSKDRALDHAQYFWKPSHGITILGCNILGCRLLIAYYPNNIYPSKPSKTWPACSLLAAYQGVPCTYWRILKLIISTRCRSISKRDTLEHPDCCPFTGNQVQEPSDSTLWSLSTKLCLFVSPNTL